MREEERLLSGVLFCPGDQELRRIKLRAHNLCTQYNRTFEDETETRQRIVGELFGSLGEGCFFHSARAHGHEAGLSALQVVDTTGAGDIFGGSAVWKLLQTGKAPQDLSEAELRGIVRFACTAAGLSTTKQGGLSSIPTLEQVQARLAEENRA